MLALLSTNRMWGQSCMYDSVMTADECTPKQIMEGVACANAGVNRATIVKTDGSLWTWGAGHLGQLGDGKYSVTWSMHYNFTPTKIMDGNLCSTGRARPRHSFLMGHRAGQRRHCHRAGAGKPAKELHKRRIARQRGADVFKPCGADHGAAD